MKKSDREALKALMRFVLLECKVYRKSYTVLHGADRGRLLDGQRDITDEIELREKQARRFLRMAESL